MASSSRLPLGPWSKEAAFLLERVGHYFRHYREPGLYQVKELFLLEGGNPPVEMVLYENYDSNVKWGRPVSEFLEEVEWGGLTKVARFSHAFKPDQMVHIDEDAK